MDGFRNKQAATTCSAWLTTYVGKKGALGFRWRERIRTNKDEWEMPESQGKSVVGKLNLPRIGLVDSAPDPRFRTREKEAWHRAHPRHPRIHSLLLLTSYPSGGGKHSMMLSGRSMPSDTKIPRKQIKRPSCPPRCNSNLITVSLHILHVAHAERADFQVHRGRW